MSHNIMRRKEKRKRNMEKKKYGEKDVDRGSTCHRKTEAEAEGRLKDHKMTDD